MDSKSVINKLMKIIGLKSIQSKAASTWIKTNIFDFDLFRFLVTGNCMLTTTPLC